MGIASKEATDVASLQECLGARDGYGKMCISRMWPFILKF